MTNIKDVPIATNKVFMFLRCIRIFVHNFVTMLEIFVLGIILYVKKISTDNLEYEENKRKPIANRDRHVCTIVIIAAHCECTLLQNFSYWSDNQVMARDGQNYLRSVIIKVKIVFKHWF